ncbi:hypothetical protein [Sphingobium aromaticiconvertens]|uniref:hypothetical protein n=1 Tax=Sphingobium aromaticiconvertens TaxID=365341 RepID=UPI00301987A1
MAAHPRRRSAALQSQGSHDHSMPLRFSPGQPLPRSSVAAGFSVEIGVEQPTTGSEAAFVRLENTTARARQAHAVDAGIADVQTPGLVVLIIHNNRRGGGRSGHHENNCANHLFRSISIHDPFNDLKRTYAAANRDYPDIEMWKAPMLKNKVLMTALAGSSLFLADAAHAQWLGPTLDAQRMDNLRKHQQRQRAKAAGQQNQAQPAERTARPLTRAERQAAWSIHKVHYQRRVIRDGQASADRWFEARARAMRRP